MIDIKDTVVLDNNIEYVVTSRTSYNNVYYYFLVAITDPSQIMICYLNDVNMVEVEDPDLIEKLLPMFYIDAKKVIEPNN